jgi:hypothetical protein
MMYVLGQPFVCNFFYLIINLNWNHENSGLGCCRAGRCPAQGGRVQDPPDEPPEREDTEGDLLRQLQAAH